MRVLAPAEVDPHPARGQGQELATLSVAVAAARYAVSGPDHEGPGHVEPEAVEVDHCEPSTFVGVRLDDEGPGAAFEPGATVPIDARGPLGGGVGGQGRGPVPSHAGTVSVAAQPEPAAPYQWTRS